MQLVPNCAATPQYDIVVSYASGGKVVYRTQRLVSDSGAQDLRGRGTRVWVARLLENGVECGEPVIVKDAWVDSELQREGVTLEDFLSKDRPEILQDSADEFFLTVMCHGDVHVANGIDEPPQPDMTRTDLVHGASPPATPSPVFKCRIGQHTPWSTRRKVHYRLVFKEVCTSIDDERCLKRIFDVLGEACAGMFCFLGGRPASLAI